MAPSDPADAGGEAVPGIWLRPAYGTEPSYDEDAYVESESDLAAAARKDAWLEWLTGATWSELTEAWKSGRYRGERAVDLAEQLAIRREVPHPADLDPGPSGP